MDRIRVLIVDDQHLFVEGLRVVLPGDSNGRIEVVGVAQDGLQAVEKAAECRPDVVLMDIRMPTMDGVEATGIIRARFPEIKILILTTFDDDELAVDALNHGATGYVLKDVDPADLILSIEAVYKGAFYISASVGFKLLDTMHPDTGGSGGGREAMITRLMGQVPGLTRREADVLYLAAKAYTNKQIADVLSIAEKTVKNHLFAIYDKLGIHNRLALISHIASLQQERPHGSQPAPGPGPAHP